jgi:hypothetical protein
MSRRRRGPVLGQLPYGTAAEYCVLDWRRGRCGRQRGHPARRMVRGNGAHHGQQRGEGCPRRGGRRAPCRELPGPGRRRRDQGDRPGRCRPDRRGFAGREQRGGPGRSAQRRDDRDLRCRRRRHVPGARTLHLRAQPEVPVPAAVHPRSCPPRGRRAGRDPATAAGALRAGERVGLPLHHYPLAETAAAHDAVERGAIGKVLIDIA